MTNNKLVKGWRSKLNNYKYTHKIWLNRNDLIRIYPKLIWLYINVKKQKKKKIDGWDEKVSIYLI